MGPAGSVTAIILFFLGSFFLLRGVPGVVQMLGARSWVEVPGTIAVSEVQGYTGRSGPLHGRSNFNQAMVAYSYQYEGQVYAGHRASLGGRLGYGNVLKSISESQAARRSPGQQVGVSVDPADPTKSTLDRNAPVSIVMTAIGVAVLVLAVLSL